MGSVGGSSGNWPPDDWDDLGDLDEMPGDLTWTLVAIFVALLLLLGLWYVEEYHRTTTPGTSPSSEALSSIFEFGPTLDDSHPGLGFWEWELTYHINLTGSRLDLGDMVWTVSGSAAGAVNNLTAYDSTTEQTAAVWSFTGAWTYLPGYSVDTQVGNQFLFLLNGSNNLDGVTVTLSCPSDSAYTGTVSVTVSG